MTNKLSTLALASSVAFTGAVEANTQTPEQQEIAMAQAQFNKECAAINAQTKTKADMLLLSANAQDLANKYGFACEVDLTANEVRDTLLANGLTEELVTSMKIESYVKPTADDYKLVKKETIFQAELTAENVGAELDKLALQFHESNDTQYTPDAWADAMKEVNPNEDELEVIELYKQLTPDNIDAVVFWKWLTAQLAVKRFANHPENVKEGTDQQILDMYLADNMVSIIEARDPELFQRMNITQITLPEEYGWAILRYTDNNFEVVTVVNQVLAMPDIIKSDKIDDFEEVYAKIMQEGEEEFTKGLLASEEAIEDELTPEDAADEFEYIVAMFEDDYANDFIDDVREFAPNLYKEMYHLAQVSGKQDIVKIFELNNDIEIWNSINDSLDKLGVART